MQTPCGFYFDSDRCINCRSCEVACQQWKGLPAGAFKLRRVAEITTGTFPDVSRRFFSLSCRHCAKAPCLDACPAKAIVKRPDGIVLVNQAQCIGCRACLEACPFGIPQFDQAGVMQKCDMCCDRIDNGQSPACSAACPTRALRWGTLEELSHLALTRSIRRM
jgi:anaerobic dimethyl sulfoxide reductase subunit B